MRHRQEWRPLATERRAESKPLSTSTDFILVSLLSTLFAVALVSSLTGTWLLYRTAIDETANRLVTAASSQAKILDLLSESRGTSDLPDELFTSLRAYDGFGSTGEFVIGRRLADQIEFLTERRHGGADQYNTVPLNSALAEPMRLALSGRQGTVIGGQDYRGKEVIAAYYPVTNSGLGVVAKIDFEEVRAPYITAFLLAFLVAGGFALAGGYVVYRINGRIIRELLASRRDITEGFEGIILALSNTLDHRDPYTGSHQRNVASLAEAVATHMALPEQQINGIRIGAMVHDIGKIKVPAEILARPGALDEAELSVIKQHPLTGHDILKSIRLPWPVDKIILQHHERLDGSGYPRGLTEQEICLEAKIIAACDTLEAIAAHRPYRPRKSLAEAIEVLMEGRGALFDATIVDTLRAMYERGELNYLKANHTAKEPNNPSSRSPELA